MSKLNKINIILWTCAFIYLPFVHADETFLQDGNVYILKSDLAAVIRKSKKFQMHTKSFDIYPLKWKPKAYQDNQENKFRVVYRKKINPKTKEILEIPGILTGDIIVESKDISLLKTKLKLKKSYPKEGFYIYQLPDNQSVAQILKEFSKQKAVQKVQIEIIEHLSVPL